MVYKLNSRNKCMLQVCEVENSHQSSLYDVVCKLATAAAQDHSNWLQNLPHPLAASLLPLHGVFSAVFSRRKHRRRSPPALSVSDVSQLHLSSTRQLGHPEHKQKPPRLGGAPHQRHLPRRRVVTWKTLWTAFLNTLLHVPAACSAIAFINLRRINILEGNEFSAEDYVLCSCNVTRRVEFFTEELKQIILIIITVITKAFFIFFGEITTPFIWTGGTVNRKVTEREGFFFLFEWIYLQ